MNKEQIKDLIRNYPTDSMGYIILANNNQFQTSEIGKALKRNQIDKDGIAFLLKQICSLDARVFIYKHAKLSMCDLIRMDLVGDITCNGEYDAVFAEMPKIANSADELINVIKDKFYVDLREDYDKISYFTIKEQILHNDADKIATYTKKVKDAAFIIYNRYIELIKRSDNTRTLRQQYFEYFEYLFKFYKIVITIEKDSPELTNDSWTNILSNLNAENKKMPYIDALKLVSFMDKYIENDRVKAKALIDLTIGYNSRYESCAPCQDIETIIDVIIPALKSYLGDSFPFYPCDLINDYYGSPQTTTKFIRFLLYIGEEMFKQLTQEQRDKFYNQVLEPLKHNKPFITCIYQTANILCDTFKRHLFAFGGQGHLEKNYSFIKTKFGSEHNALLALKSVLINFNYDIYLEITEGITEDFIENCSTWQEIVLPINKLNDMEFMRKVVKKLGTRGILFGDNQWFVNDYFIRHLKPQELSEEFMSLYGEYIDWHKISGCHCSSFDFIKKHRNKLNFSRVPREKFQEFDDEMVCWLIENYKHRSFPAGMAYLKNISKPCLLEVIEYCFSNERSYRRYEIRNMPHITVAELLEYSE